MITSILIAIVIFCCFESVCTLNCNTPRHKIAKVMTVGSTPIAKSTNNAGVTTLPSSLGVHSCAPIYFPPQKEDNVDGDKSQIITFAEACQLAAESHRPLHLSQDITNLCETIVLRRRQHLSIVGIIPSSTPISSSCEISKDTLSSSRRIRIAGKVHSLFLLNNHSQLTLRDLELFHKDDDGDDCRKVGAAVQLRYKSKAYLEECSVTSQAGFCCWAVQKASMDLSECHLEAPLRSAVVCFGKARLEGRSCTIANVGVHGVCARGECYICLVDCSILDSAVRGLYAYANAEVCLEGCTVRGTVRPDMAAIEVSSAEVAPASNENALNQKASSLTMSECCVMDNAGVGVRIRGGVRHNLSSQNDTQFTRNLGGNEVDFRSSSAEDATNEKFNGGQIDKTDEKQRSNVHSQTTGSNRNDNNDVRKNQSNEKFQRDPSGSSFRKGDWWCLGCVPESIVQGSKDSCPRCGSGKSDGKFLSSEEVMELNRSGIWIAPTSDTNIAVSSTTNIAANENKSEKDKEEYGVMASPTEVSPSWWFDGDDAGWLSYDTESNQKLESVFQSLRRIRVNLSRAVEDQERYKHISSSKIVLLSEGRYSVNVETMEQINTDSHFLRLVQRRENQNNNKI